jgi:hypothetical protein
MDREKVGLNGDDGHSPKFRNNLRVTARMPGPKWHYVILILIWLGD